VLDFAGGPCRERSLASHPDIADVLRGQTSVIIYPAANMERFAADRLRERGIEVLAFADANPATWSAGQNEIPVIGPDEIQALHPNVPVLIASTTFDSEIADTLRRKGCSRIIPVGILNLVPPDVFVSREYSECVDAVSNPANHHAIRHI